MSERKNPVLVQLQSHFNGKFIERDLPFGDIRRVRIVLRRYEYDFPAGVSDKPLKPFPYAFFHVCDDVVEIGVIPPDQKLRNSGMCFWSSDARFAVTASA